MAKSAKTQRTSSRRSKTRSRSPSRCKKGELLIKRKGYYRKDGTYVRPTSYCIKDQGTPGRRSRGAKGGPYAKEKPWITHEGSLGGPGYLTRKTAAERHKILDKCVKDHGLASCRGKISVLKRSHALNEKYGKKLDADLKYLRDNYGSGAKGRSSRK